MNAVTDISALPAIGEPFACGLLAARYFVGAQPFALVLSPKDEGEIAPITWGPRTKRIDGALSYADGLANTEAMAAAGNKLAKKIRALRIGGHDDWYLPSRLESLLLFGELPAEFERDWYWTSTQSAGSCEYAWIQSFSYGSQSYVHKDYGCRARAVRRVPI